MKKLRVVQLLTLGVLSVSLFTACGKKKKNDNPPVAAPAPHINPGLPGANVGNYPNYDVTQRPVKVEAYRGQIRCFNWQDLEVACNGIDQYVLGGQQIDPRVPYQEFYLDGVDGFGYGQNNFSYNQQQGGYYPVYPGGSFYPQNTGGFGFNANLYGNWYR